MGNRRAAGKSVQGRSGADFPCGEWLDKSEGDGLIERELQAEALVVEPEPEAEAEPEPEAGRQK